ncbi:NAD(P)H-hydrate dehydratase [Falsirhodobacter halotolerans]|uniref:NAD(P)H-hydrate dehydratase n=1 Tax=Falsirhodobacter halotolerans TaxID=1146892 RepID=UPI001FD594E6|nr:NAD(P)H-hydrate dehydratase [Falsirhodobacter halotolerans]MCJ8139283.1 NAD(P)H-hydrate dehydratase [Falsirhodobacter halotolerans]
MTGIERTAFAAQTTTPARLMEEAGAAAARIIASLNPAWGDRPPHTAILCGPGGNGGDGYVIARHLAAQGWPVTVLALAPPRHPTARIMRDRWTGPVHPLTHPVEVEVVIDALFGTGGARMAGIPAPPNAFRIAIDLPSGLNPDTGQAAPGAWTADLTIALHTAKLGHYLADGPATCGALRIAPLDLPQCPRAVHLARPRPELLTKVRGHKYDHGHAVILGGPPGQGGAARMAARAALRIGAGLVTLAPPQDALAENAAHLNAIMLHLVDHPQDVTGWLEDHRINALCLGPGLGADRAAALVPTALAARRATVLDADALTHIAHMPTPLHDRCVLTPHEGEFARLFPDLAQKTDLRAKPDRVRDAAARAGCTILLKGHDTIIATPEGQTTLAHASYDRAAPWLATAGAGDVLAGLIVGLLARGLSPHDAAEQAACLHVDAARAFGPGLIAEDLPDLIPRTLATHIP